MNRRFIDSKVSCLLKQEASNSTKARECFERAIVIARKHNAKSLELRATVSLARLLTKQCERDEARAILAKICGWINEGFETTDLRDAKALIEELSVEAGHR